MMALFERWIQTAQETIHNASLRTKKQHSLIVRPDPIAQLSGPSYT